ncbi:MAG: phosphatidylserine decarboxylase [Syntrophus sp. PtaB.Bin001]|jgi:phosphatidylserine decarboxylase|nr:MAG: phosphatidylserine decarboxylase [Syntrophus sp. PtaB.Bin001]
MKHDNMIASEGLPFIAVSGLLSLFAILFGPYWLAAFALLATVFVVCFFRNPERQAPADEKLIVSPADGKVIRIDENIKHELLSQPCRKVSIFMNVFNVHVNRIPYSGTVSEIRYNPGKFLSANLDKASEQNERNAVLIQTDSGKEILTVQIAGLIARRIVCWVKKGDCLQRGERFGLIRFGSRLEVFLPMETMLSVTVGDKVRAGETPIGTF